jgi:formate dehydrogenase (NADP+) beta subunit
MSEVAFSSWGGQTGTSVTQIPLNYDGHSVVAFISWDGLVIADPGVSVVALADAYMIEAAKLACGECSMGYKGMAVVSQTVSRIAGGQGKPGDVALITDLAQGIQKNSACDYCVNAVTPLLDALKNYKDAFASAESSKEALAKLDYIKKVTAPCQEACPIHQDIPGYIELIRNRRNTEALETIRRTNCLPRTTGRACVAFCEKNCVRGDIDSPIAIRALKRVPSDLGIVKPLASQKNDKKDKVAIIGAGPAGLAAAQQLSLLGYQTYLYDEQATAGGMMFSGIPAYRLPKNVLASEVETIASQGVQVRLGNRIRHAEELRLTFKAVIVASGAHMTVGTVIDNWNKDYDGLMEGINFLRMVNSHQPPAAKQKALVIGGGNTAMDCVRSALRLGYKEATVVFELGRRDMPARDEDFDAAKLEGVKFQFSTRVVKVQSQNGKVVGAECFRTEPGLPDAVEQHRAINIKGSEFVMASDLILNAAGETPDVSFLPKGKVDVTGMKGVQADPEGKTEIPWLFAAGDCVSGPASIVEAMADGKRAADSAHILLGKNKVSRPESDSVDHAFHQVGLSRKRHGAKPAQLPRQKPHEMNAEDRSKNFEEVEECMSVVTAAREAGRCLRCYRVMLIVKRQD